MLMIPNFPSSLQSKALLTFEFISSDRSSYSDSVLVEIRGTNFWDFEHDPDDPDDPDYSDDYNDPKSP